MKHFETKRKVIGVRLMCQRFVDSSKTIKHPHSGCTPKKALHYHHRTFLKTPLGPPKNNLRLQNRDSRLRGN